MTMTREQRLRRCLLLCCSVARNLAYHRARRRGAHPPGGDFWISADANFIDVAVLDWCKLLADDRAEHGWRKILDQPDRFQAALLDALAIDVDMWAAIVVRVRRYRDKFLAHLDSDLIMDIPELDQALKATEVYYAWILEHELDPVHHGAIPPTLAGFYVERLAEGERVYARVSGVG
jgi:hypothetical protein